MFLSNLFTIIWKMQWGTKGFFGLPVSRVIYVNGVVMVWCVTSEVGVSWLHCTSARKQTGCLHSVRIPLFLQIQSWTSAYGICQETLWSVFPPEVYNSIDSPQTAVNSWILLDMICLSFSYLSFLPFREPEYSSWVFQLAIWDRIFLLLERIWSISIKLFHTFSPFKLEKSEKLKWVKTVSLF